MKKLLLTFVATFILWQPAEAIVELRAGYGVNTPKEDYEITSGNKLNVSAFQGFNLDAIVELPMVPFGFGLRYENMGLDLEQSGQTYKTDLTRLSALVNYRFIDFFAYFGVIGTLGFQNDMKVKAGGALTTDLDYDSSLTYSVGAEGGVNLGLISLGAELGYIFGTMEAKTATTPPTLDASLDGIYVKVLAGVGF